MKNNAITIVLPLYIWLKPIVLLSIFLHYLKRMCDNSINLDMSFPRKWESISFSKIFRFPLSRERQFPGIFTQSLKIVAMGKTYFDNDLNVSFRIPEFIRDEESFLSNC